MKCAIAQRMFSSCVRGWNCAVKSRNGGWKGGVMGGRGGQARLPWVFRLAALLADIYYSEHQSQRAPTAEGVPTQPRLSSTSQRSC